MVCNDSPVLDIDLQTCSVKDLDFSNKFSLVANRTDYIHAFVGWFEVYFSHGSQTIKLSTSMELKNTHWKQSVFYIDDEIPIRKGEMIEGSILAKKDKLNPRELNIKLSYRLGNEGYSSRNKRWSKYS